MIRTVYLATTNLQGLAQDRNPLRSTSSTAFQLCLSKLITNDPVLSRDELVSKLTRRVPYCSELRAIENI